MGISRHMRFGGADGAFCFAAKAVVCAMFAASAMFYAPQEAGALWPFKQRKDAAGDAYMARVGQEVITREDFLDTLKKLHMSNRVGRNLAEEKSFDKQNYRKFLEELIDNKLMVLEAENLGLDQKPDFIGAVENYVLNTSLMGLRQEEVVGKVEVSDKEIEEYHAEQEKKKAEGLKPDAPAHGHAHGAPDKADKNDSDGVKDASGLTPKERVAIKNTLFLKKAEAREKEFFEKLRASADVKKDADALGKLSQDNPETLTAAVAAVNGKPILGKEVIADLKIAKAKDTAEAREQALDRLVLHKLLDAAALRKDYASKPEVRKKIEDYRDRVLVNDFKRKVLAAEIKVEESEIEDYYNKNKEKYREPDKVDFALILVPSRGKALEILEEIKKGSDFRYLAKKHSTYVAEADGGVIAGVSVTSFPEDVRSSFYGAKKEDILGPFSLDGSWGVINFQGMRTGGYMEMEKAKPEIAKVLVNVMYREKLDKYLKRLREVVKVEINQEALKAFEAQASEEAKEAVGAQEQGGKGGDIKE